MPRSPVITHHNARTSSSHFRDGRPLRVLIQDLLNGCVHPLKDDRLVVDVVKDGNKIWYIDNCRLYCFKEYEQRVGPQEVVIRVRLHTWHRVDSGVLGWFCLSRRWHSLDLHRLFWQELASDAHTLSSLVSNPPLLVCARTRGQWTVNASNSPTETTRKRSKCEAKASPLVAPMTRRMTNGVPRMTATQRPVGKQKMRNREIKKEAVQGLKIQTVL